MPNESNLIPFTGGPDPRRTGRKSPVLDDPERLELFVQALCNGMSVKDLSDMFDVAERTVRTYKHDPRVRAAALKYIEERVIRVTRQVDTEIEKRLEECDELDTTVLLQIRKEFLGGALRMQTQGGKTDATTINEAMDEIESNPEFAKELQELLAKPAAKA